MSKFDRRTVVGKRFLCDTKNGKKCEPVKANNMWDGYSVCKHCKRVMTKPAGRK